MSEIRASIRFFRYEATLIDLLNMNWTKQLLWLCICVLPTNNNWAAETLLGPFVPNSCHYTLVPGGSFESGKSLPSEGWSGYSSFTANVVFKSSPELPYDGTN